MADNFHNKPFDEATKLKLEIFGECFREWLPVFIFNPTISKIFIYDFFAGSGQDSVGYPGSPLILLHEAKGENCSVCKSLNGKEIIFAFNDKNKSLELETSVKEYLRETNAAIKFLSCEPLISDLENINLHKINWVIVGGESGPNARPIKEDWVINIYQQCKHADIPFFFKQWGGVNKKKNGKKLKGEIFQEMPEIIENWI